MIDTSKPSPSWVVSCRAARAYHEVRSILTAERLAGLYRSAGLDARVRWIGGDA